MRFSIASAILTLLPLLSFAVLAGEQPSTPSATVEDGYVSLSWSYDGNSYDVQRRVSGETDFTTLDNGYGSFQDFTAAANTQYEYRLRKEYYDEVLQQYSYVYSDPASITTGSPPSPPSSLWSMAFSNSTIAHSFYQDSPTQLQRQLPNGTWAGVMSYNYSESPGLIEVVDMASNDSITTAYNGLYLNEPIIRYRLHASNGWGSNFSSVFEVNNLLNDGSQVTIGEHWYHLQGVGFSWELNPQLMNYFSNITFQLWIGTPLEGGFTILTDYAYTTSNSGSVMISSIPSGQIVLCAEPLISFAGTTWNLNAGRKIIPHFPVWESNLSASIEGGSIKLTWNRPDYYSGQINYRIFRNHNGTGEEIGNSGDLFFYDYPSTGTYNYYIQAYDLYNVGGSIETSWAEISPAVPNAPNITSITTNSGITRIAWEGSDPANTLGYVLRRYRGTYDYSYPEAEFWMDASTQEYLDNDTPTENDYYYYKISAWNAWGENGNGSSIFLYQNTAPFINGVYNYNEPVFSTQTSLNVDAWDNEIQYGDQITYFWEVQGPASFNDNTSYNPTVTFMAPGEYYFSVTVTDSGGLSVTSYLTVNVIAVANILTVTPQTSIVAPGGTCAFQASTQDQFGILHENVQPTWVASIGEIDSNGLFTAPAEVGTGMITAFHGGTETSATIVVTNVAIALPANVGTLEDTDAGIGLPVVNPIGEELQFTIVDFPLHGALSGEGAARLYTPHTNFNGTDSFTFKATNIHGDSNIASVNITVSPANDAPVLANQQIVTRRGIPVSIPLPAVDVDGDGLHYWVDSSLAVSGLSSGFYYPNPETPLRYTAVNSEGIYFLNIWASDSQLITTAEITIVVLADDCISLTEPVNATHYQAPATVFASAVVTQPNIPVDRVEFFANDILILRDETAPYEGLIGDILNGTGLGSGSYTIKARLFSSGVPVDSASVTVHVNALPEVKLVSPVSGITISPNTHILVTADAFDPDGSIKKVEFYAGLTKIGEREDAPYTIEWQPPAGEYTLTARAIDQNDEIGVSEGVNILVTAATQIAITSPLPDTILQPGLPTTVVTAGVSEFPVSNIELFANGVSIAVLTEAPFEYVWSPDLSGDFILTAVLRDIYSNEFNSEPVAVRVNAPIMVELLSPDNTTQLRAPASITIDARAYDLDNDISRVEFYLGQDLIGTDTSAPYSITVNNVTEGPHQLWARAYNELDQFEDSSPASVVVYTLPQVAITSPAHGAEFEHDVENIPIFASAMNGLANIVLLELLVDGVLVDQYASATHTFIWPAPETGWHRLSVRATDENGRTNVSTAVDIVVNGTIPDTSGPEIITPNDIEINTTSTDGIFVVFPTIHVRDDFDPNPVVTTNPPMDYKFPVGDTLVTITARDHCTPPNESQAQFNIKVKLINSTPVVHPSIQAPELPPNVVAVPVERTEKIGVFFAFNPEDIQGVTKPMTSPVFKGLEADVFYDEQFIPSIYNKSAEYRGWIPATQNASVRATVMIVGGVPPYKIVFGGSNSEQSFRNRINKTLSLNEGLNTISIQVTDAADQTASYSRKIYSDNTPPVIIDGFTTRPQYDDGPYNYGDALLGPDDAYTVPYRSFLRATDAHLAINHPVPVNASAYRVLVDDLLEEGSGLARMDLQIPGSYADAHDTSGPAFQKLLPRDTEGDTYANPWQLYGAHPKYGAWVTTLPVFGPTGEVSGPIHGSIYPYEALFREHSAKVFDAAGNSTIVTIPKERANYEEFPYYGFVRANQNYYVAVEDRNGANDNDVTSQRISQLPGNLPPVAVEKGQVGVVKISALGRHKVHRYTEFENQEPSDYDMEIRVYNPQLLIDENGDGTTENENQERQVKYGAFVPLNDNFDAGQFPTPDYAVFSNASDTTLRLLTFDASLFEQIQDSPNFSSVEIIYSSNLRVWKSRSRTEQNLVNSPSDEQYKWKKLWNFSESADRNAFESLDGKLYVECLPEPKDAPILAKPKEEHRYIELRANGYPEGNVYVVRVNIHPIHDKGEGNRDGQPRMEISENSFVNLQSGALVLQWPLARTGSSIIPSINLYYNSRDHVQAEMNPRLRPVRDFEPPNGHEYEPVQDRRIGELPRYFRHSLEMRLFRGSDNLYLIDADGSRILYQPNSSIPGTDDTSITWQSEDRKGHFGTIRHMRVQQFGAPADNYNPQTFRDFYVMRKPLENQQWLFDYDTGKLVEIRDAWDNFARLEYEEYGGSRGHLKAVYDNQGHFITFNTDSNGLTSLVDSRGWSTAISIASGAGSITSPWGNYSFVLNDKGLITQFKNIKNADYLVANEYGVVSSITRAEDGRILTLNYNFNAGTASINYWRTQGDPEQTYQVAYNTQRQLWTQTTFKVKADQQRTQMQSFNDFGQITGRTNQYGLNTVYSYNSSTGQLESITDADGRKIFKASHTTKTNPRYRLNGPNLLSTMTLRSAETDGKGNKKSFEYNGDGFLKKVTDPIGKVDIVEWNESGAPKRVKGPRPGYSQTLEYSDLGYVKGILENYGSEEIKTLFDVNGLGQVKKTTLNDLRTIVHHHDIFARSIGFTGPIAAAGENLPSGSSVISRMDDLGVTVFSQNADGKSSFAECDKLGRVKKVVDQTSAVWQFDQFTPLMQPKSITMPGINGGPVRPVTKDYDYTGRNVYTKLPGVVPEGYSTSERDSGRIDPYGSVDRELFTTFNDLERKVISKNERGHSSVIQLSKSGLPMSVSGDAALPGEFGYDGTGSQVMMRSGELAASMRTLDAHGNISSSEIVGMKALTETILRDAGGHPFEIKLPGGRRVLQPVDGLGRSTTLAVDGALLKQFNYTNAARPTLPTSVVDLETQLTLNITKRDIYNRVTESSHTIQRPVGTNISLPGVPVGSQTVTSRAQFLNSGGLHTITDGNNSSTQIHRDSAGRVTGTTDSEGVGNLVEFDNTGRVTISTNSLGGKTENIYDAQTGFLKAQRYFTQTATGRAYDGGVVYHHDQAGNVRFEIHALNVTNSGTIAAAEYTRAVNERPRVIEYVYNSRGQVIERWAPGATVPDKFTYTPSGLIETETSVGGHSKVYAYDKAGRLKSITSNPGSHVTTYTINDAARTNTVEYPDGRTEIQVFDVRGRLLTKSITGQGTLTYSYEGADLRSIQDSAGGIIEYFHDTAHRRVKTVVSGTNETLYAFDKAGNLVGRRDAKNQRFVHENSSAGRLMKIALVGDGEELSDQQTFEYQGGVPTKDGSVSWTLDKRGRVVASGGATFEYQHPLGLMTKKTYGGTVLNYQYSSRDFLQQISDGTNRVNYQHAEDGRPELATFSMLSTSGTFVDGLSKRWEYDGKLDLQRLSYSQNNSLLVSMEVNINNQGRRESLKVSTQAGVQEDIAYSYDGQFRLSSETRTAGGATTATAYAHDAIGRRQTRTVTQGGNTVENDVYYYNSLHQLTHIQHASNVATSFAYDKNGNTLVKSKSVSRNIELRYKNNSGHPITVTWNVEGVDVRKFTVEPTQGGYGTLVLPAMPLGPRVKLVTRGEDFQGSSELILDELKILNPIGNPIVLQAEDHVAGNATVYSFSDTEANGGNAVAGLDEPNDYVEFDGLDYPVSESFHYDWNAMDRMTTARRIVGGVQQNSAVFDVEGGWQVKSQNVDGDSRVFSWGHGGELLSETIAGYGTRTYVNAGLDQVLWSKDSEGQNPLKFWLQDLNGSVYGMTNSSGVVLGRQQYDAFGNTKTTNAAGGPAAAVEGSRTGYTGRMNLPEVGLQYFRNRFTDPQTGRFLSMDPKGMIDGPYMYGYCGGDPVNYSDPMGTEIQIGGVVETGVPLSIVGAERALVRAMIESKNVYSFESYADLAKHVSKYFSRYSQDVGLTWAQLAKSNDINEYIEDRKLYKNIARIEYSKRISAQGEIKNARNPHMGALAMLGGVHIDVAEINAQQMAMAVPHFAVAYNGVEGTINAYNGDYKATALNVAGILLSRSQGVEFEQGAISFAKGSRVSVPNVFVLGETQAPVRLMAGRRVKLSKLGMERKSARLAHDEYLETVRPGAKERVFETPWSQSKGLGARKFDDFDDLTMTGFEANTTPWAEMTAEQLYRKLDQAAADFALLRTRPNEIKRIIWFGTEELPASGLGSQLKEALEQAGIPYFVVKP